MLVLTRKAGEELVIGDNVRLTVTKISGNRVTLGVSAPDDVRIVRGELKSIIESFENADQNEPRVTPAPAPGKPVVYQPALRAS